MKLSGHLTLQVVDEITKEVVQTIEQDNIITDIGYSHATLIDSCNWGGRSIFISDETDLPVRTKTSIHCLGVAYQSASQPPMQAFQNANPPYLIITQTLDSLSTARTFQTVGLTPTYVGQNVDTDVIPYAYLLLNAPCTQEINQILLLTYRITVQDNSLPNIQKPSHPRWLNSVCYSLVYGNGAIDFDHYLYNMVADAPLREYNWKLLTVSDVLNRFQLSYNDSGGRYDATDVTWQGDQKTLFFRKKRMWDFYRTNLSGEAGANGRLLNGVLCGNANNNGSQAPEPEPYVSKSAFSSAQTRFASNLQSAFAYSILPPVDKGPMFLASNNPSGSGVLSFSEDPWTGTWPTIYRVKITEGGAVGTAKYVLGIKHFTSFTSDGNFTYNSSTAAFHPYVVSYNQPYLKCHGWQFASPILAIDDKFTVQYDRTGLSIIHQFTGQHFDFDATTSPALPITDFRQIAIDAPRNLLYAACSSTGLWRINITNKSSVVITNVSTTPTYAVDVDKDGVVYAVMNLATTVLSLTSSASSYVTDLGFAGVALSTIDWLNIYVNKIHTDTRIAISVRNNINSYSNLRDCNLYWWSLADGDSTSNYISNIQGCGDIQTSLAWVNGNDNRFWVGGGILLTFDSGTTISSNSVIVGPENIYATGDYISTAFVKLDGTSLTILSTYFPYTVNQDVWGNYINQRNGNAVYSPFDRTNIGTYNSYTSNVIRSVTLTNGILLSSIASAYIMNNGMDNANNKWLWYKWDGTNWVRAVTYDIDTNTWTDTTGSSTKLTSTSPANLLDGINISFANGVTEPSFVAGEVYDQYVAKGILKTNDNYVYIDNCTFYTQPVFTQVPLTSTVISAANDYGVVLDGAPGDTALSSATSAITVNPLWHSIIPEYTVDNMAFTIDNVPITTIYSETINTIPDQNTLITGQIILYRNGLILCSSADVNKTLAGYFTYVARSD